MQCGILVCGSVVGDLEDVDRTEVRTAPQQGLLRRWFEVSQQEQGQPRAADQQDHAGVVGTLRGRPGGRRPQHLPLQGSGPAPLPLDRVDDRHAGLPRDPVDERGLCGRLLQPRRLDQPHRAPAQHTGQASHVVGVEMRQHQHRHPSHAEGAQAAVHGPGLRARVHHHGLPGADGEHGGVPLPHGALHVAPVGRGPAGDRAGELRRPQHGEHEEQCQDGAQPAPSA